MPKIINVFINGTDEEAHDLTKHRGMTSLANLLNALVKKDTDTINLCLNGCSIDNHYSQDLGAIFTFNLEHQVNEVVEKVKEEINKTESLQLNLYGFSRGGAAVFWICQKLKNIPKEQLTISASAFEPVPGNFMRSVYLDKLSGANTTLSSQICDLSGCKNLSRLQVLFTCDPLPDIACHGPILPILPTSCEVEVDVTAGCHKSSELFGIYNQVFPYNKESAVSFHQIVDFLEQGGLQFDFSQLKLSNSLQDRSTKNKINLLREIEVSPTSRSMHFDNEIKAKKFISKKSDAIFLNLYHQKLEGNDKNLSECALILKDYNPKPTYSNCLKSIGIFKNTAVVGSALASYATYSYFSSTCNT
ncbi:hypothetical protein [Legionella rowbothamii]|uniref:hypothetical protein n=1 Tax=Legionella rowbothamii TaxID=96229 RepID=UPI001054901A|nr:hypothetical protein [Legionella rowbothamii]